jgi:hypothetical protein
MAMEPTLEPVVVSIKIETNYTASTFDSSKFKSAMVSAMAMGGAGEVKESDIVINVTNFPSVKLFITPRTREQGSTIEDIFSSPDADKKLEEELVGAGFPGTIIIVYVIEKHYTTLTQNDGGGSNDMVLVVLLVLLVLLLGFVAIDHVHLDGKFRQLLCCCCGCCATKQEKPAPSTRTTIDEVPADRLSQNNPMFEVDRIILFISRILERIQSCWARRKTWPSGQDTPRR